MSSAPLLEPHHEPARAVGKDRLVNAAWGCLFLAPVILATQLSADPSGMGTHRQLGLPPCTFLFMTGFPCPFCGMTTSWTLAAHLHLLGAIRTQPMGTLFFLISVTSGLALAAASALGAPRFKLDRWVNAVPRAVWIGLTIAVVGAWAWKIVVVKSLI